ncbi:MAG: ABC transporter substrate-binding protein, partial [Anaerolineae bacterium]|nr:ABC transporter substrate-binding protein [Anaerolineae bacterium]
DDNNPQKVVDGLYDFGVGGALAYSQSNGAAVTVIASILQFGPEAFFARADSGIVAPADLAGRTVAVKSSGWELLLTALLEREGLTLDDITPVEAGFDMTPFLDGEVEVWGGFLTDEVVRARLAGLDLVTLPLYEYGIDTSAMVVYTSTERLEADPDLAVRFLRASLRGWEWALDHPTEAVDMMLEMYPDLAEEREFHEISFDATMPLVRPPGSRLGAIDCDDWVAQSILDEMESTDGLCTTTILESLWADD